MYDLRRLPQKPWGEWVTGAWEEVGRAVKKPLQPSRNEVMMA